MKLYARLVVALGFPIAAACTLSLPLIPVSYTHLTLPTIFRV